VLEGRKSIPVSQHHTVPVYDVHSPLRVGTWRYSTGRGSSTARGICRRCYAAALGGHLAVLRCWAWEHDCPWDSQVTPLYRE